MEAGSAMWHKEGDGEEEVLHINEWGKSNVLFCGRFSEQTVIACRLWKAGCDADRRPKYQRAQ